MRPSLAAYRSEIQLLHDLEEVERHRWNAALYQRTDSSRSVEQRWVALKTFGADPFRTTPADVADLIQRSAVRDVIVSALDRQLWYDGSEQLRSVLQLADPDEYRDQLRDAVLAADDRRITTLAADPRALRQPRGFVVSLGESHFVSKERRREILALAVSRFPNDVTLFMALGLLFPIDGPVTVDERPVWFQAAVAAAPTNSAAWNNLAATLVDWREFGRAENAVREAIRLDPLDPNARGNLGVVLFKKGDLDGAEAAFRRRCG